MLDEHFSDGTALMVYSRQVYPPLGLCYLASSLKRAGVSSRIMDFWTPAANLSALRNTLLKSAPKLVGIYTLSFDIQTISRLIKLIRGCCECRIVLGGPHITHHPQSVGLLGADFGIRGDAEDSLVALSEHILLGKGALDEIAGLVFSRNGQWTSKEPVILKDLDSIPFPDFSVLGDPAQYRFLMLDGAATSMVSSRGCPFDCVFCGITLKRRFFARSPENIVEEMAHLANAGYRYIDFKDDCFSANKERAKSICRMLIDRKISILWGCETRIDRTDNELLELMARAGCHNIRFGVESVVPRVRAVIGKDFTLTGLSDILRSCRRLGIITVGFFLVGHPTESLEEMRATADFAVASSFDIIEFNLVVPIPGSRLYEIAKSEGTLPENIWEDVIAGHSMPTYVPNGLTLVDMECLKRHAMLRFYLKFSTILRFLRRIRSLADLRVQLSTAKELLLWNLSSRTTT
ncbi:MAG: radical SAM protein [Elusimicrobiota bacterium]